MSRLVTEVPDDWVMLVLRPVRDPLARQGLPERAPVYRLRLLLKRCERSFGFHVEAHRTPLTSELGPGVCPRCLCDLFPLELSE